MLHKMNLRISTVLVVASLLVVTLFLAACDTPVNTADVPFGLKADAVEDLLPEDAQPAETTAGAALADPSVSSSQEATGSEAASDLLATGGQGYGNGGNGNRGSGYSSQAQSTDRSYHDFDTTTAPPLTTAEIEGLSFMREEEKLARDVYLALYDQWGMPVFQNIASSEQAHMDSILMLLEQYKLADPAAGKDVGQFSNSDLQALYDQLVADGLGSQADALKVGALIEEIDIVDLQGWLGQTSNEYLIQVYSNLLAGSENHLRAFVSNLERQYGEIYSPSHLSQAAFEAILDGGNARGNGNGGNGNGGGGRNGGNGGNGRRNNSNV